MSSGVETLRRVAGCVGRQHHKLIQDFFLDRSSSGPPMVACRSEGARLSEDMRASPQPQA